MAMVMAIRLTAMVAEPATAIQLMVMVTGPAITAVTDTPIAPLPAISMPGLWVSDVTGATKGPTRATSLL